MEPVSDKDKIKAERSLIKAYLALVGHRHCLATVGPGERCFYYPQAQAWAREQIDNFQPVIEVER